MTGMHAVFDASSITEKEGSQSPVLDPNKRVRDSKRGPLIIPKQGLKKPLSGYIFVIAYSSHHGRDTIDRRESWNDARGESVMETIDCDISVI